MILVSEVITCKVNTEKVSKSLQDNIVSHVAAV